MDFLCQALKLFHLEQIKNNSSSNELEHQYTGKLTSEKFINTVVSPDVIKLIAKKLVQLTKPMP